MINPTFLKTLSLCVLVICAATLGTFSQEQEAVERTLPAENIPVTDVDGRTITVTVVSRDAQGIAIKTADGSEHEVAWGKLSQATVDMLNGKKVAPPVRMLPEQAIRRLRVLAKESQKDTEGLPVKQLHELYATFDPKVLNNIQYKQAFFARNKAGVTTPT